MVSQENQRNEEKAALEKERKAFERFQVAFFAVNSQLLPHGNGAPTEESLDALESTKSDWDRAKAEIDRITEEIRIGKRK